MDDCYATTARLETFMDKNFMGAPKTTKSTKILVLKNCRLYGKLFRRGFIRNVDDQSINTYVCSYTYNYM